MNSSFGDHANTHILCAPSSFKTGKPNNSQRASIGFPIDAFNLKIGKNMNKRNHLLGGILSSFILSTNVAHAEMKQLSDDAYIHFSNGYSSLVVVGNDGVLVVDPAFTDRARTIKSDISGITDTKVTHVVLTHEHYDHVGGTEVFDGAEIVCHETCQKIFDLDVLGITPKKVTLPFADNLRIDLGGKIVELLHMGAGDGVSTTIVHVPEDKIVATADMSDPFALTRGSFIDDRNYLGVRKILNELSSWNYEHSITGHSDNTDPDALKANAEFVNDLYDAVKAELDAAMTEGGPGAAYQLLGGELQTKVKLPKYESWDGYNEHLSRHVWRMGMSILHGG
ncbi:MBL fold metallo-hydrolase [Roseibium album]|uniref:MBL fold metallo-hydrolase n=1 Tax=Roseibium album TaxID=311410 RepID=UPI0032EE9B11